MYFSHTLKFPGCLTSNRSPLFFSVSQYACWKIRVEEGVDQSEIFAADDLYRNVIQRTMSSAFFWAFSSSKTSFSPAANLISIIW